MSFGFGTIRPGDPMYHVARVLSAFAMVDFELDDREIEKSQEYLEHIAMTSHFTIDELNERLLEAQDDLLDALERDGQDFFEEVFDSMELLRNELPTNLRSELRDAVAHVAMADNDEGDMETELWYDLHRVWEDID